MDAVASDPEESARAVARVLVVETVHGWLGDQSVPFNHDDTAPYLAALFHHDDPEAGALWQCLRAMKAGDIPDLTAALNDAARICGGRGVAEAARAFADLAYAAALACGSWAQAEKAALMLERLADLDECPRAAERWERRALVHGDRVRRGRSRKRF